MNRIIALDTGLQRLGYCHISYDDESFNFIKYGTFETSSKDSLGKRLDRIYHFLSGNLLSTNFLIYEYPNFTNKQSLVLGSVIGVIELAAYKDGVDSIKSISPTEVKKKIYGKGTASKNQVKLGVIRTLQEYGKELDLSKELDDTIDAIAIALVTYKDLIEGNK